LQRVSMYSLVSLLSGTIFSLSVHSYSNILFMQKKDKHLQTRDQQNYNSGFILLERIKEIDFNNSIVYRNFLLSSLKF